jgi:signal transduction histidine kinase
MGKTDPENTAISMLYVEDDQASREDLAEIIRMKYPDLALHVADNGKTGLELFKQFHPEIVLTDINMPDIDGIKMSAAIKNISPATEIIVLTAYSDCQYLLKAIEIGVDKYVLKPVALQKLCGVVNKTIANIKTRQVEERQNRLISTINNELSQKKRELELANQELESFNYSVAHDLRTPLVSISGYSCLLLDKHAAILDDDCRDYLQKINREIFRMNSLIQVLLNFSLNTRKVLTKSMTSLSKIAHEVSAALVAHDPERSVNFSITEGLAAFCDPDLMRIVLVNLFGNAWKFSALKDGASIEFGMFSTEEALVYFVRDNGAGFEPEDAEKIFLPFQRLQCDESLEGFGIGLATVCRIIQRHGGRIWAEGEKGRGATFFFTL